MTAQPFRESWVLGLEDCCHTQCHPSAWSDIHPSSAFLGRSIRARPRKENTTQSPMFSFWVAAQSSPSQGEHPSLKGYSISQGSKEAQKKRPSG